MKRNDALDNICKDIVAFRVEDHEDGYVSNALMWQDRTVRKYWLEFYSDEAKAEQADSSEENEPEGDDEPYPTWTNEELRTELARRGLDVTGNKAELVARLEKDDESSEG